MNLTRTLLLAAVLAGGGFAAWRFTHVDPKPAAALQPIPVTVAAAKPSELPVYVTTIGTVRPLNAVEVRPQIGGVLIEVPVREGDAVRKGQVLATIDARPLKAALEKAQAQLVQDNAQLENAQLDQKRYSALASRDFASKQQLDTQTATVNRLQGLVAADRAAIDEAAVSLSYAVLIAPFDGQVGIRRLDPGNLLQANSTQAILTLVQEQPTSVIFNLPESDLMAVRDAMNRGSPTVLADTSDDRKVLGRGKLRTIDNAVDSSSGTIQMRAEFPNSDRALTAGQFVNVRVQVDTAHGILVPHTAIQHGQQGLFVFVITDDKSVKRQAVQVAYDDGAQAILTDGVDSGENVVVAGQTRIGEGTKVSFKSGAEPGPQQSAER